MTTDPTTIDIPRSMLPSDGRFGCGPSKIRAEQALALAKANSNLLGSSHRQPPVKNLVGEIRAGLTELFSLPDGWEILLGNGGTTMFWDAATFGLVAERSQHYVFGEFSAKFFEASANAPHLEFPMEVRGDFGSHPPLVAAEEDVDAIALTHNETSTGVAMELRRPAGGNNALVLVDATSAAGGLPWSPGDTDVYYFAPQKCFASDGGLWLAACSPAAIQRIESIKASGRWTPASLDLKIALDNSRLNQTYNTPALGTLVLLHEQLTWMLDNGGLAWCAARCRMSSRYLYEWAEASTYASPFVKDPAQRSAVVGTIDLDESVRADDVCAALRANGVVDTDSYRKLGRNQLRIGMFPAVEPEDVVRLTGCIDYVVGSLAA
ncbi:MAG TPA: phosphoserine transaminase [Ilumatobacteraceae bacterium]|nr:phosphoserine transaminase [Ilumatobacteraceae bacterium]